MWIFCKEEDLGSASSLGFYNSLSLGTRTQACANIMGPWKLQRSANCARLCPQHGTQKRQQACKLGNLQMVLQYPHLVGLCKVQRAHSANGTLASGDTGVQTKLVTPQAYATHIGTTLQD